MNPEILNLLLSGEVRIVFRKKTNGLLRNLLETLTEHFFGFDSSMGH